MKVQIVTNDGVIAVSKDFTEIQTRGEVAEVLGEVEVLKHQLIAIFKRMS